MPDTVSTTKRWIFETALPFWSVAGVDRKAGGFVEHLSLDGADGGASIKRVRAQARQIYVFSHAALLGWPEGREIAYHGWSFLSRHGRTSDGGWARTLDRSGGVIDNACDAYDMAFVLFAHAWYYRLAPDPLVLQSALLTVDALDLKLRHPGGYGWHAAENCSEIREQNPHMHIAEAALELFVATGHPRFRVLLEYVVGLFQTHIFDRETGLLHEFYTSDWTAHADPVEAIVEPGHMLEWSWILRRAQRLVGLNVGGDADLLYRRALEIGQLDNGLIIDQADGRGRAVRSSCRSWPQTEALKAHLAAFETGDQGAWSKALRCADNIHQFYLSTLPAGCWIDQLDADLMPDIVKIPSTTFYHLFLGFSELQRVADCVSLC